MLPKSFEEVAKDVLDTIKLELKDDFDKLSDDHKQRMLDAAQLWAKLEWRATKGEIVLTDNDRLQMEAQVSGFVSILNSKSRKSFWRSVYIAGGILGEAARRFAFAALLRA